MIICIQASGEADIGQARRIHDNLRAACEDGALLRGAGAPEITVDNDGAVFIPSEFVEVFFNSSIPEALDAIAGGMEDEDRARRFLACFGMGGFPKWQ